MTCFVRISAADLEDEIANLVAEIASLSRAIRLADECGFAGLSEEYNKQLRAAMIWHQFICEIPDGDTKH